MHILTLIGMLIVLGGLVTYFLIIKFLQDGCLRFQFLAFNSYQTIFTLNKHVHIFLCLLGYRF